MTKRKIAQKAQNIIEQSPVFFDTETTGLDDQAEVVDICIVDADGKILFSSLIKPLSPIPAEATRIHHISNQDVASAPTWGKVWPEITTIFSGRMLVIYNADFDLRMIKQSCQLGGHSWNAQDHQSVCVMKMFAEFYGEINPKYGSFKWKSLDFAGKFFNCDIQNTHRAKDDTLLTRLVLLEMANWGDNGD